MNDEQTGNAEIDVNSFNAAWDIYKSKHVAGIHSECGYAQYHAMMAGYNAGFQARHWVRIEDELPPIMKPILAQFSIGDYSDIDIFKCYKGEWTDSSGEPLVEGVEIVAWQSLPELYTPEATK